jgi:hypothetical protein
MVCCVYFLPNWVIKKLGISDFDGVSIKKKKKKKNKKMELLLLVRKRSCIVKWSPMPK